MTHHICIREWISALIGPRGVPLMQEVVRQHQDSCASGEEQPHNSRISGV